MINNKEAVFDFETGYYQFYQEDLQSICDIMMISYEDNGK